MCDGMTHLSIKSIFRCFALQVCKLCNGRRSLQIKMQESETEDKYFSMHPITYAKHKIPCYSDLEFYPIF